MFYISGMFYWDHLNVVYSCLFHVSTLTSNILWIPFHRSHVICINYIQPAKSDIRRCAIGKNPNLPMKTPFSPLVNARCVFPEFENTPIQYIPRHPTPSLRTSNSLQIIANSYINDNFQVFSLSSSM